MTKTSPDLLDFREELDADHRDAMLDVILAFAKLDVALSYMVSAVFGLSPMEGAKMVARMPASQKFEEMRNLCAKSEAGKEAALRFRRHKKTYESAITIRNRIAHSVCLGVWNPDRLFLVFSPFEQHDADHMAMEAIPIGDMHAASKFALRSADHFNAIATQAIALHERLNKDHSSSPRIDL